MNRRSLLGLLALALLAAGPLRGSAEDFQVLTPDEVQKSLGAPGFAVFDVNVPELWAKHRVPGAVHVTGKDLAPLLPADRDTRLVFYCTNPK